MLTPDQVNELYQRLSDIYFNEYGYPCAMLENGASGPLELYFMYNSKGIEAILRKSWSDANNTYKDTINLGEYYTLEDIQILVAILSKGK